MTQTASGAWAASSLAIGIIATQIGLASLRSQTGFPIESHLATERNFRSVSDADTSNSALLFAAESMPLAKLRSAATLFPSDVVDTVGNLLDDFSNIADQIRSRTVPELADASWSSSLDAALRRIDQRDISDVHRWSHQLAGDLSKYHD